MGESMSSIKKVYCTEEEAEAFDKYAAADNRSVSQLLKHCALQYIRRNHKKDDSGEVITIYKGKD